MEMVAQWVRWTRWRGDDERMTKVQWAWAYRHTCGIAHKWLKALEEKEKPFKLGSKRVAVDIKSVTKIAAPESYQVLWEEHLTEKTRPHRENPDVDRDVHGGPHRARRPWMTSSITA